MVIAELLRNWSGEKLGELPYVECTETHFRKMFQCIQIFPPEQDIYIRTPRPLTYMSDIQGNTTTYLRPELLSLGYVISSRERYQDDINAMVFERLIKMMNTHIEERCIQKLQPFINTHTFPKQGWIAVSSCNIHETREYNRTNVNLSCYLTLGVAA